MVQNTDVKKGCRLFKSLGDLTVTGTGLKPPRGVVVDQYQACSPLLEGIFEREPNIDDGLGDSAFTQTRFFE